MSNFRETAITTHVDADGVETITKVEKKTSITRNEEPDYIKVYTNMWSEFTGVPAAYRELFLQLALRMTYCNAEDLENAQLVNTGKPFSESIKRALKWKDDMLYRGLRELVQVGAIKKVNRGVYQINPSYAGKGEWKYNARLNHGGIEELVVTFKLEKDGRRTVDNRIVWADDGRQNEFNEMYRNNMGVKISDETVLTHTTTKPSNRKNEVTESPHETDSWRYFS